MSVDTHGVHEVEKGRVVHELKNQPIRILLTINYWCDSFRIAPHLHEEKYSMSTEENKVYFRQWIYQEYRTVRQVMITLPVQESNLVGELEQFSQIHLPLSQCQMELRYLLNSLQSIRAEIRKVYKSLSSLRRGIDRSSLSDQDFERKLEQLLKDSPYRERILKHIEHSGGVRAYLKRTSLYFRPRFDSYTKCISIVKQAMASTDNRDPLGKLVISVAECLPETPGEPDVQYFLGCLIKPLICVVVIVVLVVLEDEIDPDPDDSEEDPEDNGGGICEPQSEDIDAGICVPQ